MTILVIWATVLCGILLVIYFARSDRPGWPFTPLAWITALYVYDLGVGALTKIYQADAYAERFGGTPIPVASDDAILPALRLGVALYGSILAGLFVGDRVSTIWSRSKQRYYPQTYREDFGHANELAQVSTWACWGLGMAAVYMILDSLGGLSQLDEIMRERRLFSSEEFLAANFSGYLVLLTHLAPVGALMLLGMARSKEQVLLALVACGLALFSHAAFGGRWRTLSFLASAAIVWGERVSPLRTRHWITFGGTMFGLMIVLNAIRTGMLREPFGAFWETILYSNRLDTIALIQETFPWLSPYTGGTGFLAALGNLVPGAVIPGAEVTWATLVEVLFKGKNPHLGLGGESVHSSAQLYLNFGLPGVLAGGFLLMAPFGALFAWHRRHRGELLATIVYARVLPQIVLATGSGLIGNSTGVWFDVLLAVVLCSVITANRLFSSKVLVANVCIWIQLFTLWKGFGLEWAKPVVIAVYTSMWVVALWVALRMRDELVFVKQRNIEQTQLSRAAYGIGR
jgi:hypothetical protein